MLIPDAFIVETARAGCEYMIAEKFDMLSTANDFFEWAKRQDGAVYARIDGPAGLVAIWHLGQ